VGSEPHADDANEDAALYDPDADLAARATAKREQCNTLGDFIERAENSQAIVNVNDGAKLKVLAVEREKVAERAGALRADAAGLPPLHARYVAACRAMAAALRRAAGSPDGGERKAALVSHRKLDGEMSALIDEINAYCATPVTE
jgi:hypothetical protein